VDDGVGAVLPEQVEDGSAIAYVGVVRADRDHLVGGRGRDDGPPEVAGAATGDEQAHQKTR
jgi:hypothetical protein